jgi:hypothetical protein
MHPLSTGERTLLWNYDDVLPILYKNSPSLVACFAGINSYFVISTLIK